MRTIIDVFDHTYIISLQERSDRRLECVSEFRRHGIEIPNSRVSFYIAHRPTEKGEFPTIGSRGSYTSHLAVLKLALAEGFEKVLIVEDDIFLKQPTPQHENCLIEFLASSCWDVVYLGYLHPPERDVPAHIVDWYEPTIGGHFYGVSRDFILKMITYMTECEARSRDHPLGGPTFRDGAYNNVKLLNPELRFFMSNPSLASQRSSRTDLHNLRFYDRIPVLRPLVQIMRALKNELARWREW